MKMCPSPGRLAQLTTIAALAVIVATDSAAAVVPQDSTQTFAILAGTAVTCTQSTVTGDVGVSPGSAVTRTGCHITGTVHAADAVAEQAYLDFVSTYNDLRDQPPACDENLTGTLAGQTLLPAVYCVDATAKTGTLILDAQGDANAGWTFLVQGALTGTNFNVVMINGGEACNVQWWVRDAATLTTSNFLGTILAGATITACQASAGPGGKVHTKCNQGVGNGPEGCDPGNSNHHNPSNDERGGTPGNPGRKGPRT